MRIAIGIVAILGGLLAVSIALEDVRPRAEVVFAQASDCFTLDPQRMTYQQDIRLARGLYEGLVRSDPDTGRPLPAVARSWRASDDGLRWTFEIDPAARWSNGDPVSSLDVRAGLLRALLPDTAADYSGLLMAIDGTPEFLEWRMRRLAEYADRDVRDEDAAAALWAETEARFDADVGIACPDERTFELRLSRPVPHLLNLMGFPICSPVHRATLDAHTRLDVDTGRRIEDPGWTAAGTLVSNGPYVLARRRHKRDLRLERNPHYRDPDRIHSESIEAVVVEDPSTAVLAYVSGEFDWLSDVTVGYRTDLLEQRAAYLENHAAAWERGLVESSPDEALAALPDPAAGERRDIHAVGTFGTDFFHFNCRPELDGGRFNPFADPAVRRAFTLATDRDVLVERVTRLREPTAQSLIPPGVIPYYEIPQGLGFDPEAARRELAAAGWVDRDGDGLVEHTTGTRFPTIDLLYSTGSSRWRDICLALESMWESTLGVEIAPRGQEQRYYREDLRSGNFMIARGGWFGDFLDPTTFLDLCRTGDGNNLRGYSSRRVDGLLAEADRERDPTLRFALLEEAERIIVEEDCPVLPICRFVTVYMYEPGRLRGLANHAMLDHDLALLQTSRSSGPAVRAVEATP